MMAVHEVCDTILEELGPWVIHLGDPQEIITHFKQMGFPECMEVFEGTHIPFCASLAVPQIT